MGGHEAAQQGAHGWVGGRVAVGTAFSGGDGCSQLVEGVVVVEIAADVGGGALVELVFGRFDGLFEGAALGEFRSGDVACQPGMDAAIFAGGQNRSQRLIELVVGLLGGGVHILSGYWIAGGRISGTERRCCAGVTLPASRARCRRGTVVSGRG